MKNLPNEPEKPYLMVIQQLKAAGTSKAEIPMHMLEVFPDLRKG